MRLRTVACSTFYIRRHQGKHRAYWDALKAHGWQSLSYTRADVALFDNDVGPRGQGFRPELATLHERDVPVFMYPHAARPALTWDMREPWPWTKAYFAIAEGHKEVMARYGYPFPVEVTGWTYCPILPFERCDEDVPRVLFAPIHAESNGYMRKSAVDANRKVYADLVELAAWGAISLAVRHVGPLSRSRLERAADACYIAGRADGCYDDIENADVVIANQTYAYMAVAMGKPTVMFLDTERPCSGASQSGMVYAQQWDAYREAMRYPFNAEDGELMAMIRQACSQNSDVDLWKRRFIGEMFDPDEFVDRLERYL